MPMTGSGPMRTCARLPGNAVDSIRVVFEPHKGRLSDPRGYVPRLPGARCRPGSRPPVRRDRNKPQRWQADPWRDPGVCPVPPVARPDQLCSGHPGKRGEHLAM